MMAAIVDLRRGVCDSLGRNLGGPARLGDEQRGRARNGLRRGHRRAGRLDIEKRGSQRVCAIAAQEPGISARCRSATHPALDRPGTHAIRGDLVSTRRSRHARPGNRRGRNDADARTLPDHGGRACAAAQYLQAPSSPPGRPAEPKLVDKAASAALAWLTGGNAVVRIGVVVLFIGLSFLAKYAAENALLPLEFRLALVGATGIRCC